MRVKLVSPNGQLLDSEVNMNDILDVAATAPMDGQILKYNAAADCWVCATEESPAPVSYNDRGDPSSWDFSKADFTTDGEWHVLNLSGIVPEGATIVHLSVYAYNAYNESWIFFCKKGIVNREFNREPIHLQHGGNIEYYQSVWVACDSDRKIEYWMTNRNWGKIDVLVRGWIK